MTYTTRYSFTGSPTFHTTTFYGPYAIESIVRTDNVAGLSVSMTLIRDPPPYCDILMVAAGGHSGATNQYFGGYGTSSGGGGGGGGEVREFFSQPPLLGVTDLYVGGGTTGVGESTTLQRDGSGFPDYAVVGGGVGGSPGAAPSGYGNSGACGGGAGESTGGGGLLAGVGTVGFDGGDNIGGFGWGCGGGGMGGPGEGYPLTSTNYQRGAGGPGIASYIQTGSPIYYGGGGGGGGRICFCVPPTNHYLPSGPPGLGNGFAGSGGGGTGDVENFPTASGHPGFNGMIVIKYLAYPAGWRLGVQFQGGGNPL